MAQSPNKPQEQYHQLSIKPTVQNFDQDQENQSLKKQQLKRNKDADDNLQHLKIRTYNNFLSRFNSIEDLNEFQRKLLNNLIENQYFGSNDSNISFRQKDLTTLNLNVDNKCLNQIQNFLKQQGHQVLIQDKNPFNEIEDNSIITHFKSIKNNSNFDNRIVISQKIQPKQIKQQIYCLQQKSEKIEGLSQLKQQNVERIQQQKSEKIKRFSQLKQQNVEGLQQQKSGKIEGHSQLKQQNVKGLQQQKSEKIEGLSQLKQQNVKGLQQQKSEKIEGLSQLKQQNVEGLQQQNKFAQQNFSSKVICQQKWQFRKKQLKRFTNKFEAFNQQNDSQQFLDTNETISDDNLYFYLVLKNKKDDKFQLSKLKFQAMKFYTKKNRNFYQKTKLCYPQFDKKFILYNQFSQNNFRINYKQMLSQNLSLRKKLIRKQCKRLKDQYPQLSMMLLQSQSLNSQQIGKEEYDLEDFIVFYQICVIFQIWLQKKFDLIKFINKQKEKSPQLQNINLKSSKQQIQRQFIKQCHKNGNLFLNMLKLILPKQKKYQVIKKQITNNSQNLQNVTLHWIETQLLKNLQVIFNVINHKKNNFLLNFCDSIIQSSLKSGYYKFYYSIQIYQLECFLSGIAWKNENLKQQKKVYEKKLQKNLKMVKQIDSSYNNSELQNKKQICFKNNKIIAQIQQIQKKIKQQKNQDNIVLIQAIFKLFKENILHQNNFNGLLQQIQKLYPMTSEQSQQNINAQINYQKTQRMLKFFTISFTIAVEIIKMIIQQSKNQKLRKCAEKINIFRIKPTKIQQIQKANTKQILNYLNPFLQAQNIKTNQGRNLNKFIQQIDIYIKKVKKLTNCSQQKKRLILILQQIIEQSDSSMLNLRFLKSAGSITKRKKSKLFLLQQILQIKIDFQKDNEKEGRNKFILKIQKNEKEYKQIRQLYNQTNQQLKRINNCFDQNQVQNLFVLNQRTRERQQNIESYANINLEYIDFLKYCQQMDQLDDSSSTSGSSIQSLNINLQDFDLL